MLRRVIKRPRFVINCLPLLSTHFGMGGAGVFRIVFVEVTIHCAALIPERLVIL